MRNIIVTGGSGFIGTNLILFLIKKNYNVINIDKLSNSSNSYFIKNKIKNYNFIKNDLSKIEISKLNLLFNKFQPNYIINLASETHVDTSIERPKLFLNSNIGATLNLLIACVKYKFKKKIKFIHIGTDEVYGQIRLEEKRIFFENDPMNPRNPYSASKASAINFVNSFFNTYNLPIIIINPSNNYGNFQHLEKFIPKTILSILNKKKIQVYGKGKNVRDWTHVRDTSRAIYKIMTKGKIGETYNISGNNYLSNVNLVKKIHKIFKKKLNIKFVEDRPGHDEKYLSSNKKLLKLGWKPLIGIDEGLEETISWYKDKKNLSYYKNLKKTYLRLGKKIK